MFGVARLGGLFGRKVSFRFMLFQEPDFLSTIPFVISFHVVSGILDIFRKRCDKTRYDVWFRTLFVRIRTELE